ncbi:acyl-homoserine-lactone synthase [Variovorax paradoxus]|uniref:acyl-homoserine-lactone synthase n=1 Tax=Variovorax paradoxus TaxID=34073 RepID=UPI003D65A8DA
MEIIAGTPEQLTAEMLCEMALYRYRVFVEKLGWDLQTRDLMELDQFDRCDTRYLIARDSKGQIVGTARLLPTHRPYLLASVFPQLLGDATAPCTPRVWELSRFAAVDFGADPCSVADAFGSSAAFTLLGAAMRVAAQGGARRLISASPVGIERILRRAGVRSRRVAPPALVGGRYLVACLIEIDRGWRPPKDRRGDPLHPPARSSRAATAPGVIREFQGATNVPRPNSCCWPAAWRSHS